VSEPLQIWQVCLVISIDIGIDVRRLGLGVGLLLLIPYIKAALDVCPSLSEEEEGLGLGCWRRRIST
jgi:hypothetical protein